MPLPLVPSLASILQGFPSSLALLVARTSVHSQTYTHTCPRVAADLLIGKFVSSSLPPPRKKFRFCYQGRFYDFILNPAQMTALPLSSLRTHNHTYSSPPPPPSKPSTRCTSGLSRNLTAPPLIGPPTVRFTSPEDGHITGLR